MSIGSNVVNVGTSEDYEGRFFEWNDRWQATEYSNFRHWFSPSQPTRPHDDVEALRRKYGVAAYVLPDDKSIRTAPDRLRQLHSEQEMYEASWRH